jgi:hypothetical protein
MKPTNKQKYDFAARVVDAAIIQAAESSRLRDWLISRAVNCFTEWNSPNAAEKMLQQFDDLIDAFRDMVPPDEIDKFEAKPFQTSTLEYQEPEMPWLR